MKVLLVQGNPSHHFCLQSGTCAVTWVHLNVINRPEFIQFNDSKKKRLVSDSECVPNAEDLNVIFQSVQPLKMHIIFVDGIRAVDKHDSFQAVLNGAVAMKKIYLVYVTSMNSCTKIPLDELMRFKLKVFEVYSWSLEEYEDCVSNYDFMKHVQSVLDSSITTTNTTKDLILSKYYFAGSCCRYMFQYDTATLISSYKQKFRKYVILIRILKTMLVEHHQRQLIHFSVVLKQAVV